MPISERVESLIESVCTVSRNNDSDYVGQTEIWEPGQVALSDVPEHERQLDLIDEVTEPSEPKQGFKDSATDDLPPGDLSSAEIQAWWPCLQVTADAEQVLRYKPWPSRTVRRSRSGANGLVVSGWSDDRTFERCF